MFDFNRPGELQHSLGCKMVERSLAVRGDASSHPEKVSKFL